MSETKRQIVHASGILFIFLGFFMEKWLAVILFADVVAFFFLYGELVKRYKPVMGFRKFVLFMERKKVRRPFFGALLFYLGCFISFVLFPIPIAAASCSILAIGDSLSTIIGMKFGKIKIYNKRTLEGSLAFFAGAILISLLFVDYKIALIGAVVGMVTELFGGSTKLKNKAWFIDDNLLIPTISGAAMFLVSLVL
ncbi:MAG: hypothetical protein HY512_04175 [Candidatus Aenigmarchaeota archaeon]|nr:hypothetical protein [Candidatus Aenigmarchaeota archaeon]